MEEDDTSVLEKQCWFSLPKNGSFNLQKEAFRRKILEIENSTLKETKYSERKSETGLSAFQRKQGLIKQIAPFVLKLFDVIYHICKHSLYSWDYLVTSSEALLTKCPMLFFKFLSMAR